MNYFDTSALIKRFIAEAGSDIVRGLFAGRAGIATAKIAYAEVHAALARRLRDGDVTREVYARVCGQFDRDWQAYVRVELHDDILLATKTLVRRHPLRGYDAVHLASALHLRDALREELTFVAAGGRLLSAADAERLQTLNPEVP